MTTLLIVLASINAASAGWAVQGRLYGPATFSALVVVILCTAALLQ